MGNRKRWNNTTAENIAITVIAVNDAPIRTAGTVTPLTVLEDATGLLWLRQCGLCPGGGSDEASQTLTTQ